MKAIGAIQIESDGEMVKVPAFRIGKFWAVNRAGKDSSCYNVTHKATGLYLLRYLNLRRAQKLVGVLDTLMPTDLTSELEQRWRSFPKEVRAALLEN